MVFLLKLFLDNDKIETQKKDIYLKSKEKCVNINEDIEFKSLVYFDENTQ